MTSNNGRRPAASGVGLWQPTFLDVVLAALLMWLFHMGSRGWGLLLSDGDTGWHIRTGQWILENGRVPREDLFSFSKPDAAWFAWEWLADVLFALLHQWGGLALLTFFCGFLLLFTAIQLLRYMIWKGTGPVVAFPIFLLSIGGSTMHYLARPHVFSLLFLLISLWLLDSQRREQSKSIWWLVPLTLMWTNLHGAWPALFLLLGIQIAVRFWRGDSGYKTELKVGIVCALATLCNPYGWSLHRHIVSYLQSDWIRSSVAEFQSPQFRGENLLQFEILLLGSLAVAGLHMSRGWAAWIEGAYVLVWAHLALGSVRHAPILILVGAPVLAVEIYGLLDGSWATAKKSAILGIFRDLDFDLRPKFSSLSVWAVALSIAVWAVGRAKWPNDFPASSFPVSARLALHDQLRGERIFMPDQWADYWLYHEWPATRVWMDGRSDFFGEDLGKETLKVAKAEPGWEKKMAEWRISHALLPVGSALAEAMRTQGWKVLYSDGVTTALSSPSERTLDSVGARGKSPVEANGSLTLDRITRGEDPMANREPKAGGNK